MADGYKENHPSNNGDSACSLSIGESIERPWIGANDFDEKSCDAGEDKISGEHNPVGRMRSKTARSQPPKNPENQKCNEEFVNRSRMNALGGRHDSVRETHAPGQ